MDKQVLGDIFGSCHVYVFATKTKVVCSVDPAPVSDIGTTLRKPPKIVHRRPNIHWSDAAIPVWQNYTSGAQALRKIPEEYHIIEMYKTSRNSFRPNHPGVYINGENYWPVKIKHQSTGGVKWINLHEDEPTVRSFVEETLNGEENV